ncbi:MAG: DUF4382 domain-containing protein [Gammaproteobacteria bacterium]|nr:DUF4382 domain-containing protein [Gammaproteobacteria bacterium]
MNMKLIFPLLLSTALFGCSGGGGGGSNEETAANVSLYVTDNLTQEYREVWVSIYSVTVNDDVQQPVTLFNNPAGQVQNLRALVGVGALLDTQNLAAGTYRDFTVTLGNSIELVDANGLTITALFDSSQAEAETVSFDVDGSLAVTAGQNTAAAIDFDLAQFTYNASTGEVMPVLVYQDSTQTDDLVRTYAEIEGRVASITSATEFVITPESGGAHITVVLHETAVVFERATDTTGSDTSLLSVGSEVEAYGNFDHNTLVLEAVRVKIDVVTDNANKLREAEGTIVALNGTVVTLDIAESDFMPGANTIDFDTANATFTKGNATMLAVGVELGVNGTWDDATDTFTVSVVEVEGARRDDEMPMDGDFAEIEGVLSVAPADGSFSLTVSGFDHAANVTMGQILSVDFSNAWFKEGSDTCLLDGARLHIIGTVTVGGVLTATVVGVEEGCVHENENNDEVFSPEAGGIIVVGTVDMMTGRLTLAISDSANFTMNPDQTTITVDFSRANFDDSLITGLKDGAMIEVEGRWNAETNTLTATELSVKQ